MEKSILVKRGNEKTERIPVKRPRFAESKALTETAAAVKCTSKDPSDTASGISLPLPCLPCPATYLVSYDKWLQLMLGDFLHLMFLLFRFYNL